MTFLIPKIVATAAMFAFPESGIAATHRFDESPFLRPRPFEIQGQSVFNPDIALVFDFQGRLADSAKPPQRRGIMREIEIGIVADVDPFLRTEFYLAFEQEFDKAPGDPDETEVDVEAAFGVYSGVADGLDIKIGKFAGAIGRTNRNHRDQLEFMEYPLVVSEVLGGEGLRAPGVSFNYLMPGDRFNELSLEIVDAPAGPLFGDGDLARPLFIGHYRTFFDFSDDVSSQLGFSYGNGPSVGSGDSTIYGVDYVMKWRPSGVGRAMTFESEAFWYEPGAPGSGTGFGMFAALTYEISPRIFVTGKYDYVELPDFSDTLRAYSAGVTLRLTDFEHLRAEFQRIESSSGPGRTQLVFQAVWIIGPHKAHKY